MATIDHAVDNNGTCMMAFHENAPPDILHHSMDAATAGHYLDRYLAGPYLLDPLYQQAIRVKKAVACRFRDSIPDRFRSSEYYRQYYERTHLRDELDFLLPAGPDDNLVLVVGRFHKRFNKTELGRMRSIEAIIFSTLAEIWKGWHGKPQQSRRDDHLHRRLTRCLAGFGASTLTKRERQITQLLLRGHSAKSVARELRIAPGTVMVHKRNLFAKLNITSQYELFSMFISELSNY
ncbi:MAG: helix-turn-helix transcriptional regulator [Pseudomonadota bacterium]